MARTDRKKASDIFRETNYVFSQKGSFSEAYPDIESIKVVVEENGEGVVKAFSSRTYNEKTIGEFVDCSNAICYRGGVSIGNLLRSLDKGQTHREEQLFCQGYEGSPKGRRRYRSCLNSFKVVIDVVYKKAD